MQSTDLVVSRVLCVFSSGIYCAIILSSSDTSSRCLIGVGIRGTTAGACIDLARGLDSGVVMYWAIIASISESFVYNMLPYTVLHFPPELRCKFTRGLRKF